MAVSEQLEVQDMSPNTVLHNTARFQMRNLYSCNI